MSSDEEKQRLSDTYECVLSVDSFRINMAETGPQRDTPPSLWDHTLITTH